MELLKEGGGSNEFGELCVLTRGASLLLHVRRNVFIEGVHYLIAIVASRVVVIVIYESMSYRKRN